jgi:hypothetical protein
MPATSLREWTRRRSGRVICEVSRADHRQAIDWNPDNLMELGLGQARCRTLIDGKPTSAYLMQTQKVELPTGWLEKNIRNTRANYARSRKDVEYALNGEKRREWARRERGW